MSVALAAVEKDKTKRKIAAEKTIPAMRPFILDILESTSAGIKITSVTRSMDKVWLVACNRGPSISTRVLSLTLWRVLGEAEKHFCRLA